MHVYIIGATHAGTTAALRIRSEFPDCQITVIEKNETLSFLSCGIALCIEGVVKNTDELFYSSPEQLKELDIRTLMKHEVTEVNVEEKWLRLRSIDSKMETVEKFDKLIVSTGSKPIFPKIEGSSLQNIVFSKSFEHAKVLLDKLNDVQRIAIIGAGYIGIELAEAFTERGKKVTIIDREPRILAKYFDSNFTNMLEDSLLDKGLHLALHESVTEFRGIDGSVSTVVTDKGEYSTDLVILCIGFEPNTSLFKGQLDMLPNGAIIVDEYMQASASDVFAAGDCASIYYTPLEDQSYIPLATNAVKMGTLLAFNLVKPKIAYKGTQGTSGIKIFDYHLAATGLSTELAEKHGIHTKHITVRDAYRPEFMPTHEDVIVKVMYDATSQQILGAQLLSKLNLTSYMNTLSICIQNGMTMTDLAFSDFFFQPNYNKPWNILNIVGLKAIESEKK